MTEKVCPFDKKPCIGDRCMAFREDSGTCAFRSIGVPQKGSPAARKNEERASSQRFSAHLFD